MTFIINTFAPKGINLTDRESELIDEANDIWNLGNDEGTGDCAGEKDASINECAEYLDATLIWHNGYDDGHAVYRLDDGDYMIVADCNGPWGVRVEA